MILAEKRSGEYPVGETVSPAIPRCGVSRKRPDGGKPVKNEQEELRRKAAELEGFGQAWAAGQGSGFKTDSGNDFQTEILKGVKPGIAMDDDAMMQ
jgi:hypothetical protein